MTDLAVSGPARVIASEPLSKPRDKLMGNARIGRGWRGVREQLGNRGGNSRPQNETVGMAVATMGVAPRLRDAQRLMPVLLHENGRQFPDFLFRHQ